MAGKQAAKELLTVKNIRENNKTNILKQLVKGNDLTRNDLARKSSISLMTVKHIVDDLVENGIIEEHPSSAAVGRKPKALNIAKKYGNIVCINLTSAQSMSYIIYDLKRNALAHDLLQFSSYESNYREKLEELIGKIKDCLAQISTVTVGVGVSVPGAYYEKEDLTNYDLIPEFKEFHIRRFFQERFCVDNVVVVHDVVSAAKSEYEAKPDRDDSLFYLYCGFGVGGCFVLHGEAVAGENLLAGEVGKIQIEDPYGEGCRTLEEVVSIPGILKKIHEITPDIEMKEVIYRYHFGEKEIVSILDKALETVSRVLYNLVWLFNPTKFVVDSCCPDYAALIVDKSREYLQCLQKEDIYVTAKVEQTSYDEYYEMRGCFRLVLQKWMERLASEEKEEKPGQHGKREADAFGRSDYRY
ncbi:MAG: ROK family transcriptional regulator [Blautia sp.]